MKFRQASNEDWAGIWPIVREVVATGETYTWSPTMDEAAGRTAWMLPAPAEVWVATDDDGTVIGTAMLRPNYPTLGDHVANASFMVPASAGGRGVGRALAERIIERARELGFRSMQFNAVVSTNTRAVALWRSMGFEVVGTSPGAYRHATLGYVDLLIMFRDLTKP
ncbi:L-amino acid N-acyltransferase YncA [Allocatelliglobosispora scoriae]|uniref:L-amino acid N-acyltransferase YncA n=1 Tax=Allocatelliglobosispora scoriae TaxID=643052 RepID=A0A841BJK5_9ACTN|nr:GNAT family N-acetyltransferase [Allocatelliglobosispora scoriae]MBB5867000.1 L-amino acid N-acyltransferase YncA [Allocatelliglobosispora scoriae]